MNKIKNMLNNLCPNGVEYKTLGEIGTFFGGITGKTKSDFQDGNAVFISYKNVYSNPSLDISPADRVKIGAFEKQRTLEIGDIIFTGSSEIPEECGISSVVTKEPSEPLYLNSFCFFLRLHNCNLLYPDFSKYLFRTNEIRQQIIKTASGVTRFNVSKKLMRKVMIPVPPYEIQVEIASVLDKLSSINMQLIDQLENELIARKKQYEHYVNKLLNFNKYKH